MLLAVVMFISYTLGFFICMHVRSFLSTVIISPFGIVLGLLCSHFAFFKSFRYFLMTYWLLVSCILQRLVFCIS